MACTYTYQGIEYTKEELVAKINGINNFEIKENKNAFETTEQEEGVNNYDVFYNGNHIGRVAILSGEHSKDYMLKGINFNESERGKGLGKAFYKWLNSKANLNGGTLYSDFQISESALRVWKSLEKEGLIENGEQLLNFKRINQEQYREPIVVSSPVDQDMYFNPVVSAPNVAPAYPVGELVAYRALKQEMLNNVNKKLVRVKAELRTLKNRSTYKEQLLDAEKQLNKKRIELEDEIKKLETVMQKSTSALHDMITKDLARATVLANSNLPEDTYEAAEIARFIQAIAETNLETVKGYTFGKHPIFTQDELQKITPSEKAIFKEWARQAEEISNKVVLKNDEIVENLVNNISSVQKLFGRKLNAADLRADMKDVDWVSMFAMDIANGIFSSNGVLPQAALHLFNSEMEHAQAKYRLLEDKIDRLTPKLEAEMKRLGYTNNILLISSPDYSMFFQQNRNGLFGKGMALVDMLSSEFYSEKKKHTESMSAKFEAASKETDATKKQTLYNSVFKERDTWIRKNEHIFNPAILSSIRNDPKYQNIIFKPYIDKYTAQQSQQEEDILKNLLGQDEFNKRVNKVKSDLDDFLTIRKEFTDNFLKKENKTRLADLSQAAQTEINIFTYKENPFYAAEAIKTGQYKKQPHPVLGVKEVFPTISNIVTVPKDAKHYDSNYKKIVANPVMKEFYELSRDIAETMKAIFPTDIQKQLLDTSLNYMSGTLKSIILYGEGDFFAKAFHVIRKMWHDLISIIGIELNNGMSYAHYDYIKKGQSNFSVNSAFMTSHLDEIKAMKSVEIAKFRTISGITDLKSVNINLLNNDARNYLKKFAGGDISNLNPNENVYNMIDAYAHHVKAINSSMNLPKMLKAYSNVATQYEARNIVLPVIKNIKNHYNEIKKIGTNHFGEQFLIKQLSTLYVDDTRNKANTQFESWFNRVVLDNKGIKGHFGETRKKDIIESAEKLKTTANTITGVLPLTKRVYTLIEAKNIKAINRILKDVPNRILTDIVDALNTPPSARTLPQIQVLKDQKGVVDLIEYKRKAGRTVSLSTILRAVIKYKTLISLALNISSATTNFLEGQISNLIEAEKGDNFTPQNLNEISPIDLMASGFVNRMFSIAGKQYADGKTPEHVWKLNKIIERYDIFADIANEIQHSSTESIFDGLVSGVLMSPTRITEYYNQAPLIAAIIKDVKIKGTDSNGNAIETDLLDAMERIKTIDGYQIKLKTEYNTPENRASYLRDFKGMKDDEARKYSQKYVDLKVKIDQTIKNAHGDYNKFTGMMAKETVAGQAFMSLRTWLPRQLYIRFAPEQDDILLGVKGFKGFARSHITPTVFLAGAGMGLIAGGLPLALAGGATGLILNAFGRSNGKWGAKTSTSFVNDLLITTQLLFKKMIGMPINIATLITKPLFNAAGFKGATRLIDTMGNKALVYDNGFKYADMYTIMAGTNFTERDYKNFKANLRDLSNLMLMYAFYMTVKVMLYSEKDPEDEELTKDEREQLEKEKAEHNVLINIAIKLIQQATSYYNAAEMARTMSVENPMTFKFFGEQLPDFFKAATIKLFGEDEDDIQVGGENAGESRVGLAASKAFLPAILKDPMALGFGSSLERQFFKTDLDKWFWSKEKKAKNTVNAMRQERKAELKEENKYTDDEINSMVREEIPYKPSDMTYEELLEYIKEQKDGETVEEDTDTEQIPDIPDEEIPDIPEN